MFERNNGAAATPEHVTNTQKEDDTVIKKNAMLIIKNI
jgi:hypothetical protein